MKEPHSQPKQRQTSHFRFGNGTRLYFNQSNKPGNLHSKTAVRVSTKTNNGSGKSHQ
jgi:hypothetical protein